jgi:hypothetical protein
MDILIWRCQDMNGFDWICIWDIVMDILFGYIIRICPDISGYVKDNLKRYPFGYICWITHGY